MGVGLHRNERTYLRIHLLVYRIIRLVNESIISAFNTKLACGGPLFSQFYDIVSLSEAARRGLGINSL